MVGQSCLLKNHSRLERDRCSRSAALLRYFNPIGAHESGIIGEDPKGIDNLMPLMLEVAIGKRDALSVFGDDYDTPDGTGIRDYIHVDDLADGHIAALNFITKETGAEVFNLGTGNGVSVLELISAFERATGLVLAHKLLLDGHEMCQFILLIRHGQKRSLAGRLGWI